jgi:hypothetical protein
MEISRKWFGPEQIIGKLWEGERERWHCVTAGYLICGLLLSIWLSYPDNHVSIRRSYIDLQPTLVPSLPYPGHTTPG